MAKRRVPSKQEVRWLIVRLRGSPAEHIGTVIVPDAESAVQKIIEQLGITDSFQQKPLMAVRET